MDFLAGFVFAVFLCFVAYKVKEKKDKKLTGGGGGDVRGEPGDTRLK